MARMLIRNGWVITMDAALGDIAGGDVLIEDDRIAAVGPHLTAESATMLDGLPRARHARGWLRLRSRARGSTPVARRACRVVVSHAGR